MTERTEPTPSWPDLLMSDPNAAAREEIVRSMAQYEMRIRRSVPPGLRQLAEQEGMTEYQVNKFHEASLTIRGKRPNTVDEWRTLWNVCKPYMPPEPPETETPQ